MRWIRLVAMVMPLAVVGNAASAAEHPELQTKKARKVILVLDSMGIDNPEVIDFVHTVDSRIDNGSLRLMEEKVAGGKLRLHYKLGASADTKRLELKFTPDDSRWEAVARTNEVKVTYKLKF